MLKNRKISLATLLSVSMAGLVSLTAGLVLALSSYANYRNTSDLINEQAEFGIDRMEAGIRNYLKPVSGLITRLTDDVANGRLKLDDRKSILDFVDGARSVAPQIAGVLVWSGDPSDRVQVRYRQGQFLVRKTGSVHRLKFDEIVEHLAKSGSFWWETPRYSKKAKETYINIWAQVKKADKIVGLIATGISVSGFSATLKQATRDDNVTPFVLYGNNHVLAHPKFSKSGEGLGFEDGEIGIPRLDNFIDRTIANFAKLEKQQPFKASTVEVRKVKVGNTERIIISRKLTGFGSQPWYAGVYFDRGRYQDQQMRLIMAMAIGAVLTIMAVLFAFFLARRVSGPVGQMARSAVKIGELELTNVPELPASSIQELDEQSKAFNTMLKTLRLFETYIPKRLVQQLIQAPDQHAASLREANLTVMFVDIIGFTSMSENMSAAGVARLLNGHFCRVNECIEATNGTIDKYIGDAVMAFWGAPEEQHDHADRACRAALAIAAALEEQPVRVKIAIHTGELIVGDIGSSERVNYTVIGDTVNTCSRIETIASRMDDGASAVILVSQQTRDATSDDLCFEASGSFAVKGKQKKVKVYRLKPDCQS